MKIAYVFPGQGSQSVGMLQDLADRYPDVRATFDAASTALGFDLWAIVSAGPEEKLNQTQITQPAMLTAGVATWRAWQAEGGPDGACVAGHSLGEYTALVCAGAIDFADAVKLVADRARFMQEAVPAGQGAMAAILGLDDAAVRALCAQAAQGEVLDAVNYNAPSQVVIAGTATAIARAVAQAKDAGAKRAVSLPVSVPAHSRLMQPAAARLAERLRAVTLRAPRMPVLHNVHARPESDPEALRVLLARQAASPVLWVDTIAAMKQTGVTHIIEIGPGKVLTGLNKRIAPQTECLTVNDPASLAAARVAIGGSEMRTGVEA